MNKTINKEYLFVLALLFLTSIGILFQFYYGFSWTSTSGHTFASDDAFITYRYAENLFLGNGAYFNIGEKVEGYSNFLYLVLMLPAFLFTTENIYIYSTLVNTLLLFMVMFLFFKILTKHLSKTDALLGTSLIGLNPAIWANVTTGLETMLVLFIFVFLWHSVESPRNKQNISLLIFISTLSMLARVDGFIFPIIASFYLVLNKEKKLGLSLIFYTISFMSVYALIRYYYYDDIIANTYYAKVSGDLLQRIYAGIKYLYEQTFFNGIAFYALFILFYFIKNRQTLIKKILSFPFIFLFIWTSYLIYIGGDIYYERFLLVLLVLSIYYFMLFYSDKKLSVKILLLLFAFIFSFNIFFQDNRFAYQEKNYDMWIRLGKFLKVAPKDYVLAIDAAGKVPYYSELKTIDMLGLNNKEIGKMKVNDRDFHAGHTKFNADYTLSLKPHLIAAWMDVNQDQGWGIMKEKYKQEYVLKYLVNSSRENLSDNIYDVESLEDVCKSKLIQKEFNYAVLVRKDSLLHMPRLSQKVPDFCN
ncbi:MAG: hypothetical protein WC656_10600 [Sulfurimonas sp.]|jgi:hypothetical protein